MASKKTPNVEVAAAVEEVTPTQSKEVLQTESAEAQVPPAVKSRSALKGLRNAAIMFVSLIILLVGAGVLYVWLGSPEAPKATIAEPKVKAQLRETTAPVTDPKAPVGVSVQSVNSPVEPGQNVVLIAKTKPLAICQIKVEYDKTMSRDSGLYEKTADDFGVIQWSWAVEPTVPVGAWPITITCAKEDKSGVVVKELLVEFAKE